MIATHASADTIAWLTLMIGQGPCKVVVSVGGQPFEVAIDEHGMARARKLVPA